MTMTNRPIHRLNNQWQASINFNLPMVGQYDVIFYWHYIKLPPLQVSPTDISPTVFVQRRVTNRHVYAFSKIKYGK